MNQFWSLVVAGLVTVVLSAHASAPVHAQGATAAQPPAGVPVPNLSLDNARQVAPGTLVRVVGYVVGGYLCPPCPAQAQCKPCVGPTAIYVASAPDHPRVILADPVNDVLAIGVSDPSVFAMGVQYRFEVTAAARNDGGIDGMLVRSEHADEAPWPDASTEQPG